jgi:hypothetical protein
MILCLFESLADDRKFQTVTDHRSYRPQGYCFVRHRVIPGYRSALFESTPVDSGSVQPVKGRPAVEPIAHIGRDALLPREVDKERHKAIISIAVHGVRKTDH